MQMSSRTLISIISAAAGAAAIVIIAGLATTMSTREAAASMKYTQSTGKPCTFCHTTPPALTDQGKKFQSNGHKL
ncbi:hypothetical protein RA307_20100 [Xanthobacteraceae bacterium Astr-EGSB]|uniref:hypothetical protein n=1 Tax=Astrobacterium formosum TaxID=3069710 RepID=UPI0027B5FC61|nr:hypothetical protein [Xanthobacteraceae bacterium Astr-EGSB]